MISAVHYSINTMENSTRNKVQERLPFLDYGRVFVMFLVIFGHLMLNDDKTIRPYIYSFHLPFFFLVSGMLHKDRGGISWKKYWKTLIVPFLFFNLLFFILWPLCWKIGIWGPSDMFDGNHGLIPIYLDFGKNFFLSLIYGKVLPDGPTWFLMALLWCKILTDCICRYRWIAIVSLCVLIVIVLYPSYRTYFRFGNAIMVLPFFYGGFKCKKIIQQWCTKRWALLLGIVFLLLNIPFTKLNGRVSTYAVWFGQINAPLNALVFYINAFCCSLGLLVICMQFPARKYITTSAKALISILCIHIFFCYIYRQHCDQTNYFLITITSVLIFIACVLIHQLLEKYLPFSVGK